MDNENNQIFLPVNQFLVKVSEDMFVPRLWPDIYYDLSVIFLILVIIPTVNNKTAEMW